MSFRSIVETYVCQSFQTLYEASSILNVTHRSFAVFHPIMYVTHRSFAAPAPAIQDFFWLYHTYSLLRGGFYNASSGFGPRAKTLRGQKHVKFSSLVWSALIIICETSLVWKMLARVVILQFLQVKHLSSLLTGWIWLHAMHDVDLLM